MKLFDVTQILDNREDIEFDKAIYNLYLEEGNKLVLTGCFINKIQGLLFIKEHYSNEITHLVKNAVI